MISQRLKKMSQPTLDLNFPASNRSLEIRPIGTQTAETVAEREHYMHRKPQVAFAFGLYSQETLKGICVFGVPASRHLQKGVCPESPDKVIELNRLWVHDELGRNTESWFVSRCLKLLPPLIVVSYADTSYGYQGFIYRALNFKYAGWTDMERLKPRPEYVASEPGLHSRDAYRNGYSEVTRRKCKIRYWTVTGNRRERKTLEKLCSWPVMDWHLEPPPLDGHRKRIVINLDSQNPF